MYGIAIDSIIVRCNDDEHGLSKFPVFDLGNHNQAYFIATVCYG